jgi:hypothetical protein
VGIGGRTGISALFFQLWTGLTFDLDVSRFETCLAVEEVVVVLAYYRDNRYSGYSSAGVYVRIISTHIVQRGRKPPS